MTDLRPFCTLSRTCSFFAFNACTALVIAAALLHVLPAAAQSSILPSVAAIAPSSAPPHIARELPDARLSGTGSFRWYGLKLYDAALWINKAHFVAEDPWKTPFALDLLYARSIPGDRISSTSGKEIARLHAGTDQQQAAWREIMRDMFPDVEPGTRLTGIYIPEKGARFYLDGAPMRAVVDHEFARAFFAIWLDPRTAAPELRRALLSLPAGEQ